MNESPQIKCPQCNTQSEEWGNPCPSCGFSCEVIDGIEVWNPELASPDQGHFFNPQNFKKLAALENESFWFQSRNKLILWTLKHYFDEPQTFAEIGCGTGFVLSGIEKMYPRAKTWGTDLFVEGLKFASERCPNAKLLQLDARKIPYRNAFDIVGIFDVLEHIEEDQTVLEQIEKALVSQGGLMIAVPQHQWLWSQTDDDACHVRRYSAKELEDKVTSAGFEIIRSTSFVSFLLPAMFASRLQLRKKKTASETSSELELNSCLNFIFKKIMAIELALIRCGVNFAWGGSRFLIARKKR